ncbi:MAG: hypothetical protein ACREA4_03205 [Nitrososphaera sp.]
MFETEYPKTVIATGIACLIFLIALGIVCWYQGKDTGERTLNALIAMFGGLIGWILGIFLIPYPGEEKQFAAIGAAVSAFISGYLVSKLDRFFEATLYSQQQANPVAWVRVVIFGIATLLALIFVTVNRQYLVVLAPKPQKVSSQQSAPPDAPIVR